MSLSRASLSLSLAGVLLASALLLSRAQAGPVEQALPLFSAGRYAEAQARLWPYLQENPQDSGARYWYARALLGVGQCSAAALQFREVLKNKPDSLDTRFYLAQSLADSGDQAGARAELQEVLRRNPQHPQTRDLLDRLTNPAPAPPPPPPAGGEGRVVFSNGGLPLDPADVDLQSYQLKDFTFSDAPADWTVTGGQWTSTNRWTCSPQWSWYGGMANNAPAAIWTKEEFSGDLVAEMYFAFKMGQDVETRSYKNPNDVCLTICGDGANLDSGYSFMAGSDYNAATRIMRGTQVLAETYERAAMFPDFNFGQPSTYQWHRKWWTMRARKVGDLLQMYMDERLVLEARDPQPLQEGRVALWTYDNGILIPRARIYYQDVVRPRHEAAGQQGWIRPTVQLEPRPLRLASTSHPSVQNDFEYDLGDWKTLDPDSGAVLSLVPGGPAGKGHCLALINRAGGGNFGAMIQEQPQDLRQISRLSFDYKLPPAARVNLYFAAAQRWWEIVFTGLEQPSPRTRIIGRIPGVVADNQWRHAEFDLRGALEAAVGGSVSGALSHLHLGNFSNEGYLMAGFGGNPAGCTWYLDNLYLGTPLPDRTLRLTAGMPPNVSYSGYLLSVDQDPLGLPKQPVAGAPSQVTAPGPGLWYAHVQPTGSGGAVGVVTYAFGVDDAGPQVTGSDPADGSRLGGGEITVKLTDPGASGLNPAATTVALNGKSLKPGQPGCTLDLQNSTLRLDPAAAGVQLADGAELEVNVSALSDRAGNALAKPASFKYRYAAAVDKTPPAAPVAKIADGDLCNLDFEDSLGGVTAYADPEGVGVALDTSTAASGRGCLRVTNLKTGGIFGIMIAAGGALEAGKHRLVSFDYCIPRGLAVDIGCLLGGQWRTVRFAGQDSPTPVGRVENVIADGKWHHAEFNLYEMLRRNDPARPDYRVGSLVFADLGYTGSPEGISYCLDNLRISSIVSAAPDLKIGWTSPDLGGVDAVACALDNSASTVPTETRAPQSPLALGGIPLFDGFLHLRTRDRAGNWSPTLTQRLLVDSQPPSAQINYPTVGQSAAPQWVGLQMRDEGSAGIDPQSVVLSLAGRDYRVDGEGLRFDANSGILAWLCENTTPPTVFKNGQQVDVALRAAKDYAGNSVKDLPKWSWTMDYSKDTTGPQIADLTSTTHPTFLSETFESGQIGTVLMGGGGDLKAATDGSPSGRYYLNARKNGAGVLNLLLVHKNGFPAEKYPWLVFDYRLDAGIPLNLIVVMAGRSFLWTFAGPGGGAIAQVPGIRADGQWHRASIDLAGPLRGQQPQGSLAVSQIYLVEQGRVGAAGTQFSLDNLTIAAPGLGAVNCRWRASDPTGIQGCSAVLGADPGAMPPDALDQQTQRQFPPPGPGLWFLRVRAKDGAGNWGAVETYTVLSRG